MKKIYLLIAVLICLFYVGCSNKQELSAPGMNPIAEARKSVGQIVVSTTNGEGEETYVERGTGFLVGQQGKELLVVTNNHVIDGYENKAYFCNGDFYAENGDFLGISLEVLSTSKYPDISILKLNGGENLDLSPLVLSNSMEIVDSIYLLGFPGDIDGKDSAGVDSVVVTSGIVSNTNYQLENVTCFLSDLTSHGGNSGGPYLNKDGYVIGIHSHAFQNNKGYGERTIGWESQYIMDILDRSKFEYAMDAAGENDLEIRYENYNDLEPVDMISEAKIAEENKDFQKSYYFYNELAETGDSEGLYKLGEYYLDGIAVLKDEEKAINYLNQAIEQKHVGATIKLAKYYTDNGKREEGEKLFASEHLKNAEDYYNPIIGISAPSVSEVCTGNTVKFVVAYNDDKEVEVVDIVNNIIINGNATAKIDVIQNEEKQFIVTLSNIMGEVGEKISITVLEGAIIDKSGKTSAEEASPYFVIVGKTVDKDRPTIYISQPSAFEVYQGGTVTFALTYDDDVQVKRIDLNDKIQVNGVTCEAIFQVEDDKSLTVILSDIQGEVGSKGYITILEGVAIDFTEKTSEAKNSSSYFEIIAKPQS